MTARQITETIIDGVAAVEGATVKIQPWPGPVAYDSTNDDTIIGTYSTTTNASGVWTATLPPTSTLNPTGTVYAVEVRRSGFRPYVRYITVPDTPGPHVLEDVLTDAPATVSSSALQSFIDSLGRGTIIDGGSASSVYGGTTGIDGGAA